MGGNTQVQIKKAIAAFEKIERLLKECLHQEHALVMVARKKEQLAHLDSDDPEVVRKTATRGMFGMGSLTDQRLIPKKNSALTKEIAEKQLGQYTTEIYEAVGGLPK